MPVITEQYLTTGRCSPQKSGVGTAYGFVLVFGWIHKWNTTLVSDDSIATATNFLDLAPNVMIIKDISIRGDDERANLKFNWAIFDGYTSQGESIINTESIGDLQTIDILSPISKPPYSLVNFTELPMEALAQINTGNKWNGIISWRDFNISLTPAMLLLFFFPDVQQDSMIYLRTFYQRKINKVSFDSDHGRVSMERGQNA